jgi:hypothetical protein
LRSARSNAPSAARIVAGSGWPWAAGSRGRGLHTRDWAERGPCHKGPATALLVVRSRSPAVLLSPCGAACALGGCVLRFALGWRRGEEHEINPADGARWSPVTTRRSPVACCGVPDMGRRAVASSLMQQATTRPAAYGPAWGGLVDHGLGHLDAGVTALLRYTVNDLPDTVGTTART